jgi:hypothetical protein
MIIIAIKWNQCFKVKIEDYGYMKDVSEVKNDKISMWWLLRFKTVRVWFLQYLLRFKL